MTKIILGKNMKKIIMLLATTALLTVSANAECKPKWCNSKKLSEIESTICADSMLRASDALLSSTYRALMSYSEQKEEIKKNQEHWLKERNKLSGKIEILTSYMDRITILYNKFKMPITGGEVSPSITSHIKKIYNAIVDNKPEALADLMKFPKTININGKDTKFATRAKFLEKYPSIFTKKLREHIATQKVTSNMLISPVDGILLGDGTVYFTLNHGNLKSLYTEDL
jgi:uncharacterized protein